MLNNIIYYIRNSFRHTYIIIHTFLKETTLKLTLNREISRIYIMCVVFKRNEVINRNEEL